MRIAIVSITWILLVSLILISLGQLVRSSTPTVAETSKSFSAAAAPSLNLSSIFDSKLLNRIRDALSRKPPAPSSETDYSDEEEEQGDESKSTSPDPTEESAVSRRNCTRKKVPPIGGINVDEDNSAPDTNCKKRINPTTAPAAPTTVVDHMTPPKIAMNCVKRNRTVAANGTGDTGDEDPLPSKCMNKNPTSSTTTMSTTATPEIHIMPCKKRPNQTNSATGVETSSKCWNKTLTHLISAFDAQENKIGDSCDPSAWTKYVKPIYDAIFRGDASGQAAKSQEFAKGIVNDRSVLQKVCLTKPESDVLECLNNRKCECFKSYPTGMEGLFKCGNRPKQQQQKKVVTSKPTSPPKKGHITCITTKPKNSGGRVTGAVKYFYIASWIVSFCWFNRH